MAAGQRLSQRFLMACKPLHVFAVLLQKVIGGGSSWNNMYDTHPIMVEMQQRLAYNVEAESHAFFTFMTSALRRVSTWLFGLANLGHIFV